MAFLGLVLLSRMKAFLLVERSVSVLSSFFDLIIDLPDDILSIVHVDVVEADHCISTDIGRLMHKVLGDGSSQGLNDSFVHDSGDKSECPASEVLVVSD